MRPTTREPPVELWRTRLSCAMKSSRASRLAATLHAFGWTLSVNPQLASLTVGDKKRTLEKLLNGPACECAAGLSVGLEFGMAGRIVPRSVDAVVVAMLAAYVTSGARGFVDLGSATGNIVLRAALSGSFAAVAGVEVVAPAVKAATARAALQRPLRECTLLPEEAACGGPRGSPLTLLLLLRRRRGGLLLRRRVLPRRRGGTASRRGLRALLLLPLRRRRRRLQLRGHHRRLLR